ncbi:hypothetical protein P22_2980 [Propionispora sp. 2/2-37]|nr:hypothetical protein P22_2980 [Propionispora sp. 2/2-37]
MVEPRLTPDFSPEFDVGRPKINAGSAGSVLVGGKIIIGLVRLYGSPTVVVWSKGMYNGRAKIAEGSGDSSREFIKEVYCSREIAVSFAGTFSNRAKVMVGCVMLIRSRKIAYRYVMVSYSRSEDHYGLFLCHKKNIPSYFRDVFSIEYFRHFFL